MPSRKAVKKAAQPTMPAGPGPVASRPQIPPEYGVSRNPKGMLAWPHVTSRMTDAQHYWICTVDPDGRPHATPVDGLWMDEGLYFGGSPKTRWRRNLLANPAVCIHLESASEVVTLHGEARMEEPTHALAKRLSDASKKKYGYGPKPAEYEQNGVLVFRPQVVFAWKDFPKDATRWRFVPGNTGQAVKAAGAGV
jgi:nitroimidazol reductase NimA-like FMN-containing flavoprotein (pyridoxamine 5'-phosphate oxidase superfamily)